VARAQAIVRLTFELEHLLNAFAGAIQTSITLAINFDLP
jgi:hypothetical protein